MKHVAGLLNYCRTVSILLIILICLSFTGCQPGKEKDLESTIIKGRITFPGGDNVVYYSYADSAALFREHKTAHDSSSIDKNGHFFFSFHIKNPMVFDLEVGKNVFLSNLFICPGDELEFIFEGKNNKPEINISTPESKFNAYLLSFQEAFYKNPEIKQEYYIGTNYMDGSHFALYNDRRKNEQLKFFEKYFGDDSLIKSRRDYAINTIEYGIGVDRLMYVWKKRMKGETVVLDPGYFDFETKSFIENPAALSCPAYIHFLKLYIKDIYERMVERGELPVIKKDQLIPPVEKFKLAVKLLHRPYRDVVLYNIILDDMHDVSNSTVFHEDTPHSLDSMQTWFKLKYSL